MRSQLFHGRTTHSRHKPRRHAFTYRMYWLSVDLDELAELGRSIRGFGYNCRALMSINDRDYGGDGPGGIRPKITALLCDAAILDPIDRVTLITIPRIFGYVFNPVSFYICHSADNAIIALVAEVHNTFGETHHYVAVPESTGTPASDTHRFCIPKRFYVSPFFDISGEYEVRLKSHDDHFAIAVSLREEGAVSFVANLVGTGRPLSSTRLLGALVRAPLFAATIMLRIHWQALRLYLCKRIALRVKPTLLDPATIPPSRSSFCVRIRTAAVRLASKEQLCVPARRRVRSKGELR